MIAAVLSIEKTSRGEQWEARITEEKNWRILANILD